MSLAIAGILTISSVAAYTVSFRRQGTVEELLEAYGLGFFLLAGVTLLASIQTLTRAFRVRRRERRVAKEIGAQPELFNAICEILTRYDPMGLADLEEPHEYEYQAGRLLLALPSCASYEQLLREVRGHFAVWFRWVPTPPSRFAAMTQEIWNLLQRDI